MIKKMLLFVVVTVSYEKEVGVKETKTGCNNKTQLAGKIISATIDREE